MRAQQPKSRGWDTDTLGLVYRTSLKPYGFRLSLGRSAPLKVHQFIFFHFFAFCGGVIVMKSAFLRL